MEVIDRLESEEAEESQRNKFLTFFLGPEEYGIDIRNVTEIIGIQSITAIPEMPDYLKGIINLRGKIIPVMDVRIRFRKEFRPYDGRTCIIVIETNETTLGLVIDGVSEVLAIPASDIAPPPQFNNNIQRQFVKGIGKVAGNVKLLLDCQKLLTDEELEAIPRFD